MIKDIFNRELETVCAGKNQEGLIKYRFYFFDIRNSELQTELFKLTSSKIIYFETFFV